MARDRREFDMDEERTEVLYVDEEFAPIIYEEECRNLQPILKTFMESYVLHKDEMGVDTWLAMELEKNFPEKSSEEIHAMSEEIVESIEVAEEKSNSLNKAIEQGKSKESWFASEMKQAMSSMSAQESAKYLQELDNTLQVANESLNQTIITQAGTVSLNPNLDGFIAEQYHAQTFNLNAEASGSQYRAKVLEPNGKGYAKNSVDLVIVDGNGKVVRRYQSKYCKDANATMAAFKHGDYRGQRKLVPEGQEIDIANASNIIEAPDGTSSNPLSKQSAEQMRNDAQSGKWNELNWNEYTSKDLLLGIGKQAGQAAIQGAVIGVGMDIAQKLWAGEEIEGEEIVETALASGSDFGIKAVAAGALKVGIEKDIVTIMPKSTPTTTITNIAYVGVENVKIVWKMASGEYTFQEGIEKMEQTTVSTVAGLATMGKFTMAGTAIGSAFGPVGAVIGGFVGGSIGYMAGSKVGENVVKGTQKLRHIARNVVETVKEKGREMIGRFCDNVRSIFCW